MEYAEAVKKARAIKPKENFITLEVSYDKKIILPYKDGITLLAALVNAEQLNTPYGSAPSITGMSQNMLKPDVLSADDYETFRIAALLNVSVDTVKEYARQTP